MKSPINVFNVRPAGGLKSSNLPIEEVLHFSGQKNHFSVPKRTRRKVDSAPAVGPFVELIGFDFQVERTYDGDKPIEGHH